MKRSNLVEWDVVDQIGVLTINNPPKNYLDVPDFVDLDELREWVNSEELRGLIITGKKRNFSAGANKEMLFEMARAKELESHLARGSKILSWIEGLSVPVVAAIKGACFGGGLEIALAAHIRVCSENAYFSCPETELGLIPGLNGTIRLPGLVGKNRALQMILSAEIINAEKALEIGLVDYVVPPKEVLDFSFEFLKKMTKNRKIEVIKSVVKSMNNFQKMDIKEAMNEELKMFTRLALDEAARQDDVKKEMNS